MIKTMVAVIALAVLCGPPGASASVIFNWIGACDGIITPGHGGGSNGCSGQATLRVVTTDAYVPGEVFFAGPPPPVLLQALYVDENVTFDFAPFFVPGDDSFQLPASPSEGGFVQLEQISFLSDASGVWRFSGENLRPGCDTGIDRCSYVAKGFNGVWARVPAPPALVLLVAGLAGLITHRGLRNQRRSTVGP